jgi:hypothetical protein
MHRARLLVSGLLAVLALGAVTASSASAFSWWVGTSSKSSEILGEGVELPFDAAATVKSPFTLKWFKEFEVKCTGATYDEAFLEGRVFLGAAAIDLEACTVVKPAGFSVVGGDIDTSSLFGEITPAGSKVDFSLAPVEGSFASFVLEGESACPLRVVVQGAASGTLSRASKLTDEKSLVFDSSGLSVIQTRECVGGPAGASKARKEKRKKHPKEEGQGSVESNKGNVTYSSEASFWSAH